VRLAFMGSPDFAVPTLQALVEAGHGIVCVYTQPPRARGRRGLDLVVTPVHEAAQALGLTIRNPCAFDAMEQQYFASLKLDAAVVVAYGLLLPASVLLAPRFGCYNGHASLLPRWRGAAPIQRAIMAGDSFTGMMVMKMETGLDTGPIALMEKIPIQASTTAGQLHDHLSIICARLIVETMARLEADGQLDLQPQAREGVTYAHKITKQETRIDWTRSAQELERTIRALAPLPAAWCEMEIQGQRERIKILAADCTLPQGMEELSVKCGDGTKLYLTFLQKAGGKPLAVSEFLRGNKVQAIL